MPSATQTSATISWSAPYDNVGVAGYDVFLNGVKITSVPGSSYVFSGLPCGQSFTAAVDAYDFAGNRSAKSTLTIATKACLDAQPPTTPTALTESAAGEWNATLAWKPSTDNIGVAGYDLFRDGVPIGTTALPSYTFTGLVCGSTYSVSVDAYDAIGNRSPVAPYILTTSPCSDTTPPTAPTNVSQTGFSDTTVTIAWTAATDTVGVTGYSLFADGNKVGTTASTTYAFTGLTCGTSHHFSVQAFDRSGNLSPTADATGSTASCSGSDLTLFGNSQIGPKSDSNSAGQAEAFQTVASASGLLGSIATYVSSTSVATKLVVGIYANASGHPGALLTQGSLTSPVRQVGTHPRPCDVSVRGTDCRADGDIARIR
jgi:chitodextrinase